MKFFSSPVVPSVRQSAGISRGEFEVILAPRRNGVIGTVGFLPFPACPPCGRIRLVQAAKAISLADGVSDFDGWPSSERNRVYLRTNRGWFIDHRSSNWSEGDREASVYYNDSWFFEGVSTDGGSGGDRVQARLQDGPTGDGIAFMLLETAARCVEGGEYFGSVSWGFKRGEDGQGVVQPISAMEAPSPSFFEAVRKFDEFYGTRFSA